MKKILPLLLLVAVATASKRPNLGTDYVDKHKMDGVVFVMQENHMIQAMLPVRFPVDQIAGPIAGTKDKMVCELYAREHKTIVPGQIVTENLLRCGHQEFIIEGIEFSR